jgi:hypothetical protein
LQRKQLAAAITGKEPQTLNHFLPQQQGIDLSDYFKKPEQFLPLLHQMDCMLFLIDYQHNQYVYISPNAIDVLGYSAERMLKEGPLAFMKNFILPKKPYFRINCIRTF